MAGPGLASILIGFGLLVAAWVTWTSASDDATMNFLMIGVLLVGLGSYFFFGNLQACRAATRRGCTERRSEIDDLLRSGLLTAQEHETIKQAIDRKSDDDAA